MSIPSLFAMNLTKQENEVQIFRIYLSLNYTFKINVVLSIQNFAKYYTYSRSSNNVLFGVISL